MEMHQLRYFAKVAELGNVTRAAEACHVSQPSLSQQIAKLERELGQPLLERLGRGVRLTEAGCPTRPSCSSGSCSFYRSPRADEPAVPVLIVP